VDEAGFQVRGKRHWLHAASTDQATCHPKRGKEAMDDIRLLLRYKGTMVRDA
jgi:transposase